ncbi:uncharacterized protein LOC129912029 isoform X2 [Episyrphus balteatus]|uniref:uncharacterized protein LOC129912029 isoform X2 n=1 Tax=Episyrphus balteatus TaxID=286459 RepID=UPI002486316A|nr:uncharacterized protein LOC129912029 isoform X2 [Episyrphus balteatus]
MQSPITCRACLTEITLQYISLDTTLYDTTVLDVFNFCTKLKVRLNDDFPTNMCVPCVTSLQTAYDFIKTALETDQFLRGNITRAAKKDPLADDSDKNVIQSIIKIENRRGRNYLEEYIEDNIDEDDKNSTQIKKEIEQIRFEVLYPMDDDQQDGSQSYFQSMAKSKVIQQNIEIEELNIKNENESNEQVMKVVELTCCGNPKMTRIRKRKKNPKIKKSIISEKVNVLKKENDSSVKQRIRSCSVREINRDRRQNGFFNATFLKIKEHDSAQFFMYTRMHPAMFDELLNLVSPFMIKTSIREPILPECRLALFLHYLSQGESFPSLALSFKLGKETIRKIILETSEILWRALQPTFMSEPDSHDYEVIREDFWRLWNIPNCIGAIDGKHFGLRKKRSCVVIIAVCDAKYRFTHVDIGAYGNPYDSGIFQASCIGKKLLSNHFSIPQRRNLPGSDIEVPHYFAGDVALPLTTNIMRPYAGTLLPPNEENFNQILSRAHRTIENSFGILVARWSVLQTALNMLPENAEKVILACFALHNFIMLDNGAENYCPSNYVDWEDSNGQWYDGLWRNEINIIIPSIKPSQNSHQYGGKTSTTIRNNLRDFLFENKST